MLCASCQPSCRANKLIISPHTRFTKRKKYGVINLRPQATKLAIRKHHKIAPLRKPAKKITKRIGCGPPEIEAKTVVPSPVQKTMLSGLPKDRKAPLAKSPR